MQVRATIVLIITLLCPATALALVNINTASLDELDTLPGVGPATAEKIIEARPFSSVGDIENVAGIGGPGTKTYDGIIGLITLSGVTENVVNEEDESEEDNTSSSQSTQTKNSDKKVLYPVTDLHITAPNTVHVNEQVEFIAEPIDGRKNRLVRYFWNFGDGATADTASPTHSYKYPGTYVVVVESYYLKEEIITRHKIEVLPVNITLNTDMTGAVTVTNNGIEEINLHGMTVGGRGEFTFPEYSILMPNKSITVTPEINNEGSRLAVLRDQAGVLVATELTTLPTKSASRSTATVAARSGSVKQVTEGNYEKASQADSTIFGPKEAYASENQTAFASAADTEDFWPYAGLLIVILFGLYSIYASRPTTELS